MQSFIDDPSIDGTPETHWITRRSDWYLKDRKFHAALDRWLLGGSERGIWLQISEDGYGQSPELRGFYRLSRTETVLQVRKRASVSRMRA